jgi:hypothetical protein
MFGKPGEVRGRGGCERLTVEAGVVHGKMNRSRPMSNIDRNLLL